MTKGDKFVLFLIILAILANQGIISPDAPEKFVKDKLGLNFLEDIGNWSTNFNSEKPIEGMIVLLWIIIKNFWMPIIIGAAWLYIKTKYS